MMLFGLIIHLLGMRSDQFFICGSELLVLLLLFLPVLFHLILVLSQHSLHIESLLIECGPHLHILTEELGIKIVLG